MRHPMDPGPPLQAGSEFCPCEPPGAAAYLRATGAALLAVLGGGAGWLAVVLATQRLWGVTGVLLGLMAGWLVSLAAGRLRSIGLGMIAAIAAILASATGYALLWLPFLGKMPVDRQVTWYHLVMVGLGAAVAYRLGGGRTKRRQALF